MNDTYIRTLVSPGGTIEASFAPRAGMVGCSLRHRGVELLHMGRGLREYTTHGTTFGIPFLYPWANRLAGFDYFALGKQVQLEHGSRLIRLEQNGLPIHGVLGASPHWEVDYAADEGDAAMLSAVLDFGGYPALLRAFPFPHTVRLGVRVTDTEVEFTTTVAADRGVPVPISFGFHPYLRLMGAPRQQWEIELPVRERLVLDDYMIPTGERQPAGALDGPLGDRAFDDGFAGVEHERPFAVSGGGRRIAVHFDERFPFAQVFSPPGAEFICFEPMTAPTNALRSGQDLPIAQPGDEFRATWRIVVTQT